MPATSMPDNPNCYELVDPIWEQQPQESRRHYTMFLQYLAFKPFERTLINAWRLSTVGSSKEGRRMSRNYRELAQNWRWAERAAARDFFEAQNLQSKWIERDRSRREDAYELGTKLVKQSKRVLDIADKTPDSELHVSLGEAKDLAVAGTTLQGNAIPTIQLAADQMQWLLGSLSSDKRAEVIRRLTQQGSGNHNTNIPLLQEYSTSDVQNNNENDDNDSSNDDNDDSNDDDNDDDNDDYIV